MCLLIPILTGLISALLGYLLGRLLSSGGNQDEYTTRIAKLEADLKANKSAKTALEAALEACESSKKSLEANLSAKTNVSTENQISSDVKDEYTTRIAKLEADLKASKSAKTTLEAALEACESSKKSLEANLSAKANISTGNQNIVSSFAAGATALGVVFNTEEAKAVFGKKIKENDLTVVEGIGPKIQELFHDFDIKTWAGLGAVSIEKCQEILDSGGARFKMHNPKTWPKQAKLAAEGKWKELKQWQDELDGGI